MIKHIVCYKLKDSSIEGKKKVYDNFMRMKENIDLFVELNVGLDFLKSERSYDVVLEIVFENIEKMNEYQKHPYHVNIVKPFMKEARISSVSVDYEF